VVEAKKFKLRNIEKGIFNYCEGEIIGNHSSMFSFTIFTCLSNFIFGRYKMADEMRAIGREDENGNIKYSNEKGENGQVRAKNLERSNIKTFK
jgi:hypothetical protein